MKNLPGLDLPIAIAQAVDDSDRRDLLPSRDRFQLDLLAPQQYPTFADLLLYIDPHAGRVATNEILAQAQLISMVS